MGAPVRAASRRPAEAGLPAGVDVVHADLGDPDSLLDALKGVEQVFLLANGPDIPQHDANLAHAAAHAGVATIVKLSSGRAGDPSATDPIPAWHRAGEQAVRASGVAWTFLRPMGFMSNTLTWAGSIRRDNAVYAPFAGGQVALIDPDDIAAVAASVLSVPGHEGQTYTLTGPQALSPAEQVSILGEVLGRPLSYVEVTPDVARQAVLEAIMALRATALQEFTSAISPAVQDVTGTPATSFREWAQRHQDVF
jgi:uncharacterized protein YbjT (DUF2867 family)